MPSVREQFKTFHDFASADLFTIYGEHLEKAIRLETNTAETGIFFNEGDAHFTFRPLPHLAQIAPTMGSAATHLDGDGVPDLILAHNDFSPQRETGRMDGGLSLVLLGNGDGSFRILPPDTSGIALPGDARSLSTIDYLGNNRPDLLMARNSAPLQLLINNASGSFLKIRLRGHTKGNPHAVGARVIVCRKGGTREIHQITAGGGYLTQSPAEIFVSFNAANPVEKAIVTWPDGSHREMKLPERLSAGGQWTIATGHE